MKPRPPPSPPPRRSLQQLRDLLCAHLISGKLPPGARLPTREELVARHGGSKSSMQAALRQLQRDGFIVSRGRHGTFVADQPPHLHQIALAFDAAPNSSHWPHFYRAVLTVAESLPGLRFKTYFDTHYDEHSPGTASLLADVAAHRLAGAILLMGKGNLSRYLGRLAPLPLVGTGAAATHPFPLVNLNGETLLERALTAIAAAGRRRVALLHVPHNPGDPWGDTAQRLLRRHGLLCHPWWRLEATPAGPHNVAALVQLLLQGSPDERPDALLVLDDNLVPAASRGVAAMGFTTDDLLVLGHANFPLVTEAVVPVRRLGWHLGDMLRTCLALLSAQRAGQQVPVTTELPVCFADELPADDRR